MLVPGEVISYLEMCREEGVNLQRGMNFGTSGRPSIILMSRRPGAPYDDRIEEDGRVLIYEGHDTPQTRGGPDPKTLDQPERGPGGTLIQNGLFLQAASQYRELGTPAGDAGGACARVRKNAHRNLDVQRHIQACRWLAGRVQRAIGVQVPARGRSRCDADCRRARAASSRTGLSQLR